MTDLASCIKDLCTAHADRAAIVDLEGRTLSYRAVADLYDQISAECALVGLTPAHRVATLLPDAPMTAVTLLSLVNVLSVMPINPALREVEIKDILRDAKVDAMVAAPSDPMATLLAADLGIPLLTFGADHASAGIAVGPAANPDRSSGLVLLTSGSTGTPKRVPITPAAMLSSARNIAATLQLGPDDKALHALPMFHIGAIVDLLLAPMLQGGAAVICPERAPTALAHGIRTGGATWMQLVPTMLLRCLADCDDAALAQMCAPLRFIRSVSADLSADVQADAETRCGVPLIQMYGMTETAGQITSNPVNGPRKPNSVGIAAGPEIAILDATGNRCATDHDGEVCVAGPTVFDGYEGSDNAGAFFGQWFRTGDIGRMDSDGYLFLTGRKKELINHGGEKISPFEIERVALTLAGVTEAAAYPLPHPTLGDQPGLTVAGDVTEDAVLAHLAQHLADYKCPRKVRVVATLPRLGAGKVDKQALIRAAAGLAQATGDWSGRDHKIAALWAATLQGDIPGPDTDFFDAGGDSLAATTFIVALEKLTGQSIDPNLLFNAPTFGAMLDALGGAVAAPIIEPAILGHVRQFMAGWAGAPTLPGGIIRSLGTASTGQPIFWCGTGSTHGEVILSALGQRHPVYHMMSSARFRNRTAQDRDILADHLSSEIKQIAPVGPLVVGGFCDGGLIMHLIADKLIAAGREIQCFIAGDYWFPRPTPYPVFQIMSDDKRFSGTQLFKQPELAYPRLHPAGAADFRYTGGHLFQTDLVTGLGEQLAPYVTGQKPFPRGPADHMPFAMRSELLRADLRLKVPRWTRPGGAVEMTATITNRSPHVWQPTAESGLSLSAHLFNLDRYPRKLNFGFAAFDAPIAPGETARMTMQGTYPDIRLPTVLRVALTDQGIANATVRSGGQVHRLIWPRPF